VWVLWFFLLFRIIIDIFRSQDLSGWGKALWLIFVIVVPFLGVLVYVIARGGSMGQRDARQAQEADAAARSYIQSAAGTSTSTAEELTKLAALRDQGVITDAEFAAQKAKVLSS
jgi:ABC-type multidrug transport system fused ATPase/permease subunit